jgi:hypothetical protein
LIQADETVILGAEAEEEEEEEAEAGGITGVGRKEGTNRIQDLGVARS